MSRLKLNPVLLLSPVAEGYVAYDTLSNRFHELNPMAALIVELCNGSQTVEDIITIAAPLLPPDSDAAVKSWINQAIEAGLLVLGSSDPNSEQSLQMSAEDLTDLSSRLRDEGKVQAAYLCQQRAVELRPDAGELLRDLGELAHIVGKRHEARQAYQAYEALRPDDAEIQHLLTSLRDESTPARVPNECIEQLYQRFSGFYESNMCEELGYEGPQHLHGIIEDALGDRTDLAILDLGCGTGLASMALAERASRLVGVDLSPEMIEQARKRNIYDELHVAEVTKWLEQNEEQFDLILACDTLIYFGDLRQVLVPCSQLLTEGGVMALSVERAETGTFRLTDNGRYVHHPDHIVAAAEASGMHVENQTEAFLRMEYGQEVTGLFASLRCNAWREKDSIAALKLSSKTLCA